MLVSAAVMRLLLLAPAVGMWLPLLAWMLEELQLVDLGSLVMGSLVVESLVLAMNSGF